MASIFTWEHFIFLLTYGWVFYAYFVLKEAREKLERQQELIAFLKDHNRNLELQKQELCKKIDHTETVIQGLRKINDKLVDEQIKRKLSESFGRALNESR